MDNRTTTPSWGLRNYLAEAVSMAAFMVALLGLALAVFHPGWLPAALGLQSRLFLLGLLLGLGIYGVSRTPLGKLSGPQLDPVFTLAIWGLKKMNGRQALGFTLAQFTGGVAGVALSRLFFGPVISVIHFGALVPDAHLGEATIFAAEGAATFVFVLGLMTCVAVPKLQRFTMQMFIVLLPVLVSIDGPISGSGMNPARWFASAVLAGQWAHWEVYAIAPVVGSLLALLIVQQIARRAAPPAPSAAKPLARAA